MRPDRTRAPRSPSYELVRFIPLATFAGAMILSWSTIEGFIHGSASVESVLAHVALASALIFAGLRVLVAVVAHYEHQRPSDET